MHLLEFTPAETANGGAIRAMLSDDAARLIARSSPADAQLVRALDRQYGEHGWFMYWDEDLSGHPIRGTRTLYFGGETLVVG
jgi:hypothetical protein